MANLSGHLAVFRMSVKTQLAYKTDYFISLLFRMARPLILLMVWTAIYLNTGTSTIGGLTLSGVSAYFFLVMPVILIINEAIIDTMQADVQNGSVASSLIKPMNYPLNVLSRSLGTYAADIVLVALPLLVLTFVVFHIAATPLSLFLFLIETLVGIAIVSLIGFFIGTLAIRLTNVYGLATVVWGVMGVLSGAMIPLSFFPAYAQNLLMLSPFPIQCYLPVATLLGTVSNAQIFVGIAYGIGWAVLLLALAYLWWGKMSKSMGAAGG
jgi:ABC-2 type transport system permease protein